jgi:hypothetical protein
MEEKVENRGGKRENAGRKKRDKEVKPILLNLETTLYEALPKSLNRNAYINDAVREKMAKDGFIK